MKNSFGNEEISMGNEEYDTEAPVEFFVFGGEPTDISKFPYLVSLQKEGRHVCGGVLLDTNLVLTAAHCFDKMDMDELGNWKVIAGRTVYDQETDSEQIATIDSVQKHERFTTEPIAHDICVIRLKENLWWTVQAQPARFNFKRRYNLGENLTLAGWGVTREGRLSQKLLETNVPLQDHSNCTESFKKNYNMDTMICAGKVGNDACGGDSGGPLVSDLGELVGLVSYGKRGACGKVEAAVYVNVTFYSGWITEKLQNNRMRVCSGQASEADSIETKAFKLDTNRKNLTEEFNVDTHLSLNAYFSVYASYAVQDRPTNLWTRDSYEFSIKNQKDNIIVKQQRGDAITCLSLVWKLVSKCHYIIHKCLPGQDGRLTIPDLNNRALFVYVYKIEKFNQLSTAQRDTEYLSSMTLFTKDKKQPPDITRDNEQFTMAWDNGTVTVRARCESEIQVSIFVLKNDSRVTLSFVFLHEHEFSALSKETTIYFEFEKYTTYFLNIFKIVNSAIGSIRETGQ